MKLTIINSAIQGYEQKLDKVLKIIADTLSELDECEINHIMLPALSIPYYDGKNADVIANYAEDIKDSRGVIFAATASSLSPNAPMVNFMEHITDKIYAGLLENKNCLIAITSDSGGERAASEVISSMIASLKGFDAGRIMIGRSYLKELETNEDLREIIERQAEDYYRVMRQNRKFFIPALNSIKSENRDVSEARKPEPLTKKDINDLFGEQITPRFKTEDLYEKYNLNTALDEKQEQDINEITKFFASKYSRDDNEGNLILQGEDSVNIDYSTAKPREKTCKQITQSLPHYFKPQIAGDMKIIIQLNISAKNPGESFEGYLTVADGECTYNDGQSEHIDITIMGEEKAWLDVVKGKHTAQKAFMIGQLKVRGNFMFLSKMDQIFSFSMAAV